MRGKHRKKFRKAKREYKRELEMAYSRIQLLVNYLETAGHLRDGTFTFPDGETWIADAAKPQYAR